MINTVQAFIQERLKIEPFDFIRRDQEQEVSQTDFGHSFNYYANNILRRDLFNSNEGITASPLSRSVPVVSSVFEANFPQTNLKLLLKGTIVAGQDSSFAIIKDLSANKQALYKIGDTVLGAEIIAIYRRKITLMRSGKEETLFISGEDQLSSLFNLGTELVKHEDIQPQEEVQAVLKPAPQAQKQKMKITRGQVGGLVTQAKDIVSNLNVSAHYVSGQKSGYRITAIKENNPLFTLGVRDGDIIKEVNGIKINSPDKIIQAYLTSKDANEVQITINRDGSDQVLRYEIQ